MANELSEELKRFVNAEWISKAYLAEKLWGDKSPSARAKLNNKIRGLQRQRFKEDEVKKLEEIREKVLKEF